MNRALRTQDAAALAGATYRQADHWARTGLLVPAEDARGSGSQRGYTIRQAQIMWALVQLTRLGIERGAARARVVLELEYADTFTGWLVVTPDTVLVAHDPMAVALLLPDLGPAAVVELDRCPIAAEPIMAEA